MKKILRPKKLSICVPTYNRSKVLDRLLGNISHEIAGLEKQVEICVSDNASLDSTWEVIAKWKKVLPLRARRNAKNMDFDINFVQVLQMARGSFVWFCGDDDIIIPGGIKKILLDISRLDDKHVGSMYVNCKTKHGPMVKFSFEKIGVFSTEKKDYPPLNISFASSLCLNSAIAKKIIKNNIAYEGRRLIKKGSDRYLMCYFGPAYLFLECAHYAGKFAIEPECCVDVIADGDKQTYENKMYRDIILMIYPLEIRSNYDWFLDGSKNYPFRAHLIRTSMVAHRPELEEIYSVTTDLYLRLMELEAKRLEATIARVVASIRRNPLGRFFLKIFLAAAVAKGMLVTPEKESDPVLMENLRFNVERAKKKLAESGG